MMAAEPMPASLEKQPREIPKCTARNQAAAADPAAPPAAARDGDAFDRFLASAGIEQRFTVSCMAFQDAMTLDLERVKGCCIHVVSPSGTLIPFCLYNLTSFDGTTLYRGRV